MAITAGALTKAPGDGTIKGADANRSIGHAGDRWRNKDRGRRGKKKKRGGRRVRGKQ